MYATYKERTSHIFGNVWYSILVNHVRRCSCLASYMQEKQTKLETENT